MSAFFGRFFTGIVFSPFHTRRRAGCKIRHLGIPMLGTLQFGAPADFIAVKRDPTQSLKLVGYPSLVLSGGKIMQGP
ncbi:MAG: hypothetical protein ACU85E_05815 [Gammaproteobacteria bacterium]